MIFAIKPISTGGTKKTVEFCKKHNKPWVEIYHTGHVWADGREKIKTKSIRVMAKMLREFVSDHEIGTLNVAGPRASKEPGIGDFVREVLEAAFPR